MITAIAISIAAASAVPSAPHPQAASRCGVPVVRGDATVLVDRDGAEVFRISTDGEKAQFARLERVKVPGVEATYCVDVEGEGAERRATIFPISCANPIAMAMRP